MQFGDILRQLIDDNNLTQKQLGKELNIAPTTIGNYVRNIREPDYSTLKMIADFFNVSTDFLLNNHTEQKFDCDENCLLNIYNSLNIEYKKILMEQAKTLYQTYKNR